jgi:preprotein translocase subunit SecE
MTAISKSSATVDRIKWVICSVGLVGAGYANSYYGADIPMLYRFIALVAVGLLALFIVSTTQQGAGFLQLAKEARQEMRKVVWPKKHETMVTTGFVVLVVFIFSLILWAVDYSLRFVISTILG